MFDTPFESWCANVAYLLKDRGRRKNENADAYLCRVYGSEPYNAFVDDVSPEKFAATLSKADA